jgi:GNAT superfamily N-acetyltransferase
MSMALDCPLEPPPANLVVSPVDGEAGVLEWVNTFDVAFRGVPRGRDHPWLRPFGALYTGTEALGRLFIGRVGDEPVATSLAFVAEGAVGLYGIGTVPDKRGNGYGGALTLAGARWGLQRGADVAVLASSDMGYPVYERLGFRVDCEAIAWVRDPVPTRLR